MEINKRNTWTTIIIMAVFALLMSMRAATAQELVLATDSYVKIRDTTDVPCALVFDKWGIVTVKIGSEIFSENYKDINMREISRGVYDWTIDMVGGDLIKGIFVDEKRVGHVLMKGGEIYHLLDLVELKGKKKRNYDINM